MYEWYYRHLAHLTSNHTGAIFDAWRIFQQNYTRAILNG